MNYPISYMQYQKHNSLRRRLMSYLPLCVVILFITVCWAVGEQLPIDWDKLLFKDINHIRIEGEYRYTDPFEIEQKLMPFIGNSVRGEEIDLIENMIKDLPWVKDVLIQHSWRDNTLVLIIEEREAVAYWGGQALLDADAEVFIPRLIDNNDRPILDAAAGREKYMLYFYKQLNRWLASSGLRVVHLKEDQSHSYTVQLENAPRLYLGRHLFESRIKRFVAAYQVGFSDYMHRVACIDLRYLDGFAVRWKAEGVMQTC